MQEREKDFFDPKEMEEFVKMAEKEADEGGDEELKEMLYGEAVGEEDEGEEDIKFEDFFGDRREEEEDEFAGMDALRDTENPRDENPMDRLAFEGDDDDISNEEDQDEEMEEKEDEKKAREIVENREKGDSEELAKKDPVYAREREMRRQIEQLEAENLGEKEWKMRGELTRHKRPAESLLHVDLDYEVAARPAPVITEEKSKSLEEVIKERILQAAFDDVVRKKVVDLPYRPKVELSFEKSEKGLAQVYEDQFKDKLAQKASKESLLDALERVGEEKLTPQQEHISQLWRALSYRLDALANFNFTPRPPSQPVVRAEKRTAAKMEEIVPESVSEAALIAPQELLAPLAKPLKERAELSKSERQQKRKRNKLKFKDTEKKIQKKKGKSEAQVEKEVASERVCLLFFFLHYFS